MFSWCHSHIKTSTLIFTKTCSASQCLKRQPKPTCHMPCLKGGKNDEGKVCLINNYFSIFCWGLFFFRYWFWVLLFLVNSLGWKFPDVEMDWGNWWFRCQMKNVVTVLHNIRNSESRGQDFVCNSRQENCLPYLIMPPVILDPSEIK